MTLTIRIEDGSLEYENLQQVKEIFKEASATKAILAALEYAKGKKVIHQQILDLADKARDQEARADTILRKLSEKAKIDEWLEKQILTL